MSRGISPHADDPTLPPDSREYWQDYGRRVAGGDFDFGIWARHGVPPGVELDNKRGIIVVGRPIDHFAVGKKVFFQRTFQEDEGAAHAAETWDHNPFHLYPAFCAQTRFKRPILHGLLVGAMICHFGGDIYPGPAYLATSIHFDFLNPVYPGDTVFAEGTVAEIDAKRPRVKFAMACWKQEPKSQKHVEVLTGYVVGVPMRVEVPVSPASTKNEEREG